MPYFLFLFYAGLFELGLLGMLRFVRNCHRKGRGGEYSLKPRHSNHPLTIRRGTTDVCVFRQVFLQREYALLQGLKDVGLVIDCGANVGYSSAYFLSQFPTCEVLAVECDPSNFEMLKRNLAPFGDRAKPILAGVWSHSEPLRIARGTYRDGREWATQVKPCGPDEMPEVQTVEINKLLAQSGHERISVLKVDIEGSESEVFRRNIEWLDKVDAIAIELHDDSPFGQASDVFYEATQGRGFDFTRNGELIIAIRRGRSKSPPRRNA